MASARDDGRLSIVIPTYRERENADRLLRRLASVRGDLPKDLEILVMDDDSSDGTSEAFTEVAVREDLPLRVVTRTGPRSLGKAIVEGLSQCRGDLVCVMDADLSHPPETVPLLLDALDGADGVVASRYARGGQIVSWPLHRRWISRAATALAKAWTRSECTDPVSGFFLFRRSALAGLRLSGVGNKPLLEILAAKAFFVHEVPYRFRDREHGRSKLGVEGVAAFARLLLHLGAESIRGTSAEPVVDPRGVRRAREP